MISTAFISVPNRLRPLFPGVLSAVTVALAAKFISEHYGAPVMLMALLIGMAFTFLSEGDSQAAEGIEFASKRLLRFGVALLGFGITLQQVAAAGIGVLALTLCAVVLTIICGVIIARCFGKSLPFGLLTGGAVAICGASAALAIASALPRNEPQRERDVIFTVIAVTALSTLAMVFYPILGKSLHLDDHQIGVFLGATIHDVAQVVGAGYSVSDEAGATATFVKLLRVATLVPIVVMISVFFARHPDAQADGKLPIPVFVIGFSAFVLLGSTNLIPPAVTSLILDVSRWCLITAIAALGMKTSLKKVSQVGGGAISTLVALTIILAGFVLLAIKIFSI